MCLLKGCLIKIAICFVLFMIASEMLVRCSTSLNNTFTNITGGGSSEQSNQNVQKQYTPSQASNSSNGNMYISQNNQSTSKTSAAPDVLGYRNVNSSYIQYDIKLPDIYFDDAKTNTHFNSNATTIPVLIEIDNTAPSPISLNIISDGNSTKFLFVLNEIKVKQDGIDIDEMMFRYGAYILMRETGFDQKYKGTQRYEAISYMATGLNQVNASMKATANYSNLKW